MSLDFDVAERQRRKIAYLWRRVSRAKVPAEIHVLSILPFIVKVRSKND